MKILELPITTRISIGLTYALAQGFVLSQVAKQLQPNIVVVFLLTLLVLAAFSLITGPFVAILASIVTVIEINWYLIPPYYTLQVATTENLTSLIVFPVITGGIAFLISISTSLRSSAAVAEAHSDLLSTVVNPRESLRSTLERIRNDLSVKAIELRKPDGTSIVSRRQGESFSDSEISITVNTHDGYSLIGYGEPRIAVDMDFVTSLANAAVRAHESEAIEFEIRKSADLESLNAMRSSLMASIGHDLRTPLSTLRLAVESLREDTLSKEDSEEILEHIEISTHRISDTLTNLLDMSRLEAGNLTMQRSEIYVEDLLNGLVHDIENPRLHLITGNLRPIYSDATLIERILSNLINNALRHDTSGADVDVEAFVQEDFVEVHVSDQGPGFTPSQSNSATEGSRLGLQIVNQFAQIIGAEVIFQPNPVTRGTRVTVRIPVAL